MKYKLDYNKILQPNAVVHCPEEWMWDELKDILNLSYHIDPFESYKDELCILFYITQHPRIPRNIDWMFGPIDFYREEGKTIYNFNDVLLNRSGIFIKKNKTIKY